MIYLDSTVVLAHVLAEARTPPATIWREDLISSRLLVYEVWNRLYARQLVRTHGSAVESLLSRIGLVELSSVVLNRAMEPFSVPVRTLDALHLASAVYLQSRRESVALATYDRRMAEAAEPLGLEIAAV